MPLVQQQHMNVMGWEPDLSLKWWIWLTYKDEQGGCRPQDNGVKKHPEQSGSRGTNLRQVLLGTWSNVRWNQQCFQQQVDSVKVICCGMWLLSAQ